MEEIRVTRIHGGGASSDGQQIWINIETENGPARIAVPTEEAGKLPVAALQAVAAAEQSKAAKGTFVVQADGARMRADHLSAGLLLVKLMGVARPIVFQLARKGADQLYDDLRAIRKGGRATTPPRDQ
ncbi:MAG: hypothetical protein ABTQ31_13065 [Rhizobiaceae bacterium]